MRELSGVVILYLLLVAACSDDTNISSSDLPAPVALARQHLADRLRVSPSAIEVISFESRQWPDRCLGLSIPEVVCAQVITPGYRAVFRAQGREYGYRTDTGILVLAE
jgi:hypothetical protein